MTGYWLTPIVGESPLHLGKERILCKPLVELDAFREAMRTLHPRLLPMFKASLLLSDDEDHCGSEVIKLDLSTNSELCFDGNPYYLSHCAEAFLDRLLEPDVAALLLAQSGESCKMAEWTQLQLSWRECFTKWLEQGWKVVLLREDGV
jgi:hypothetical protein